jgi:hypothetical protein
MLKLLEDESVIQRYRRQFIRSFKPCWDEKIQVTLGHPGGAVKAKVFWSNRLGIWMHQEKISQNRRNHAFGVGKPNETSSVPITCEINFPLRGIDRRTGGALARDRQGHIYVVHRGKIGGGKKGVGKSLFEENYRGAWAVMEDGDCESVVAIVGLLDSPRFVRQAVQFIRKVDAMKDSISRRSSQMEMAFDDVRFREELIGNGYDASERCPVLDGDYGLIITDLHAALKRKGIKAANDSSRDLFIVNAKRQITAVFQAVTDYSQMALNAGISTLLLDNVDLPSKPLLILAVPTGIDPVLAGKIKKIGIDILEYEWRENSAAFPNLHDVMSIPH